MQKRCSIDRGAQAPATVHTWSGAQSLCWLQLGAPDSPGKKRTHTASLGQVPKSQPAMVQ